MKRIKIKTIICHMAIITICMGVFCHGYILGDSLSLGDWINSYAEADNWSACDNSDLVTAFRYYCKSRNLVLEGSIADALTSFTTTTFNNICSTLGIDPTELQAELKKTTDGNLGLRFLFTNNGITAYNRIFSEFLQNNDLAVGDTADDEVIYSGDTVDGHFLYVINRVGDESGINPIIKYGSDFYDGLDLYNSVPQTITFYGSTATTEINSYDGYGYRGSQCKFYNPVYRPGVNCEGGVCLARLTTDNKVYPFTYIIWDTNKSTKTWPIGTRFYEFDKLGDAISDDTVTPTDITVNTPGDTTINNNTYNYNYTIIYNDGDHYGTDDDDEPEPGTTPPGGGGGGDDPGGDPDDWNPSTPTIPGPNNPSFPTIDLPDIDIPDLPSLDFSLGDLRNKFPFSLPFDIIAVLNVLDGEPQAPVIDATIPIGNWYTWEFHADFSEFDNYARIFRAFEFIGFVIGLAVFTVHFAKG